MTTRQQIYKILITPRQRDEDTRNREVVLNVLLAGTLAITLLALILLLGEIIFLGYTFLAARVFAITVVALFVGLLLWLSRQGLLRTASSMLVGIYFMLALGLTYQWGVNVPTAILLYGLVIVLSGILLGPSYSLYAAALVAVTLVALVRAAEESLISPDSSWIQISPGLIDIAGFSLIFGAIALVTWLFNQQMVRSLYKAERAEAALRKQKSLLETTVQKRTRELQAAQLEKVREMYKFAELGQLSTALMHDLANHLTTLTLDIEGLEGQTRSRALGRAKRSIKYIDDMVVRVRDQLHGKSNIRQFSVPAEIEEVVKMLRHKAQANDVLLKWRLPDSKKGFRIRGETIRFRQLMANLISNAIDSYYEPRSLEEKRDVLIAIKEDRRNIIINVDDWGRGILEKDRRKLFEPFYSTKQTGMGMGLYIAKQVAEEHFLGELVIDESRDHTSFVITLPKVGL